MPDGSMLVLLGVMLMIWSLNRIHRKKNKLEAFMKRPLCL